MAQHDSGLDNPLPITHASILSTSERENLYPLTRNYYENNSLRIIFAIITRDFVLSKCPGKKDMFKELRVRFVTFPKINILE